MKIGEDDIARLAKMTRLALTPAERAAAAKTLSDIVDMMAALKEADVADADPMAHVGLQAKAGLRLRGDKAQAGIPANELMANAPDARAGFFAVPKVIE